MPLPALQLFVHGKRGTTLDWGRHVANGFIKLTRGKPLPANTPAMSGLTGVSKFHRAKRIGEFMADSGAKAISCFPCSDPFSLRCFYKTLVSIKEMERMMVEAIAVVKKPLCA